MSDNRYRVRKLNKSIALFWKNLNEEQRKANEIINSNTLSVI